MTEKIADELIKAGMSCKTKAAVISQAATPQQKTCVSDLANIAETVKNAKLISPAVIIVGDVVSLREKLNFYEHKPLFGKRYLIPKTADDTGRLGKLLQEQGASVDEICVGTIINLKVSFTQDMLNSADWLIFTSRHGVSSFFENLARNELDVRNLANCKIAAIGGKTEESLKNYGLYADLVPDQFHSDALAGSLRRILTGRESVLYLKAKNAQNNLKKELEGYCSFKEIPVYDNEYVRPDLGSFEPLSDYDGILFTCASSVKRLMDVRNKEAPLPSMLYSIGPKTTACLHKYGQKKIIEAKHAAYEDLAALCIDRAAER